MSVCLYGFGVGTFAGVPGYAAHRRPSEPGVAARVVCPGSVGRVLVFLPRSRGLCLLCAGSSSRGALALLAGLVVLGFLVWLPFGLFFGPGSLAAASVESFLRVDPL